MTEIVVDNDLSEEEQQDNAERLTMYLDSLQRELQGAREMLAHVLKALGKPVYVTKKQMREGLEDDDGINIEELPDSFVFELGKMGEPDGQ